MLRAALFFTWLALPVWANSPPPLSDIGPSAQAVDVSLRPVARRAIVLPDVRWGTKNGRSSWTRSIITGLRGHASNIPDIVPRDIHDWCPAYPSAGRDQREAFWAGLISALAWHESTHRPTAVGGGGLWYGLVQIYPDTARRYGCKARTGQALKDPEDNLSCALRIMAVTVERDKVVSRGMKGVAADWGPFHSRRKRTDMMEWTRSQDYCQGLSRSLRPVARPQTDAPEPVLPAAPLVEAEELTPPAQPFAATKGPLPKT